MLAAIMGGLLALAACSSAGTTGATTGGGTPAPTGPTATPKPKPSVVPLTDLAFCQHILALTEVNQFMSPPTPADTIVPNNTANGGSCNYTISSRPGFSKFVLAVILQPWKGTTPVSQQDLETAVTQLAGMPGVTVTSDATVSGVGDQAAFLAVTTSSPLLPKMDIFYVLYGRIFFTCNSFNPGSSPDATQQSDLQQCAQLVVSRL
jgi:hypothetical protein